MTLAEALSKLLEQEGPSVLKDIFRSRCLLADFIKDDRYERKILPLFLSINQEIDLYESFRTRGLAETRAALKPLFPKYQKEWSWEEFRDAVNAMAAVACPKEFAKVHKPKPATQEHTPKRRPAEGGIVVGRKPPAPKPVKAVPAVAVDPILRLAPDTAGKEDVTLGSLAGVKSLVLLCGNAIVDFFQTHARTPLRLALGENGKKRFGLANMTLKGSTLTLDLRCFDEAKIYCGAPKLSKLSVTLETGGFNIDSKKQFRDVEAKVGDGFLMGELTCLHLKGECECGSISLIGDAERIDIRSTWGDVDFHYNYDNPYEAYEARMMVCSLDYGSLVVKTPQKFVSRPTKLLGVTRRVYGDFLTKDKRAFHLDLQAKYGSVKVK